MEIFQSKLEEAEKIASRKEDYRRERWRKPAFSDKAQNSQESRKSDFIKCNKSSRDSYNTADIENSSSKQKLLDDEKDEIWVFGNLQKRTYPKAKSKVFFSWKFET